MLMCFTCQLLENTGKYVTIVEPDSISRLVGNYRKFGDTPKIRQLLRDVVRMECRPYRCFQPTHGYYHKSHCVVRQRDAAVGV